MNSRSSIAGIICLLTLGVNPCGAEGPNGVETASTNKVLRTPEVVVSASRIAEESWKSGSSISVVDAKTIRLQRPFRMGDVMRGEPGMTVNEGTGVPGGLSQVSIRGLPFSRTLVQVDGLRFNRPIDNIANLADLPPIAMGNIEMLRGPQSSLYGSEAEGGVVTVSTPRGEGKPSFGGSFEAGTFDTRRERAFSQGKVDGFDWNAEYSRLDSENERPNSGLRQDAAALHIGYDLTDIVRLDLASRWTDNTTGSRGSITGAFGNDPDDRLIRRTLLVAPSITVTPYEVWESKLTLGYIGVGQRSDSPPSQFVNHSESLQVNWQNTIDLVDWNTFIAGVEARNEHTTTEASSGNNVFNRATESAYFSDNIRWEDWWGLTLSARYDNNEGFRDAWTWRASEVFRAPVTDTKLHLSFGTAFRAPAISELKNLFGPASGANPSLTPETSEGYDVGITQPFFEDALELDVTYFYNDIVNMIATSPTFVFQNMSEARTEGIETSMKWQIIKALYVRGALTLTDTTNKDARFPGRDLARIPRQTALLRVVWNPIEVVDLAAVYNFGGTSFNAVDNLQELNDYNRVDLYTAYHVRPWLQIFGRAENVIGYRYQQAAGFPALGRTFYAGVEAKY